MAIKPCKECKKEISANAKICPHCGVDNPGQAPASPIAANESPIRSSIRAIGGGLAVTVALVWLISLTLTGKSEKQEAEQQISSAAPVSSEQKDQIRTQVEAPITPANESGQQVDMGLSAVITCDAAGGRLYVFACFVGEGGVSGSFQLTTGNEQEDFNIIDFMQRFNQPSVNIPLPTHFRLLAQGNGDEYIRITVRIVNGSGQVLMQRQASGYGAIIISN